MSHYFTNNDKTLKSNPQVIAFRVHDTDFSCTTDHGVFSKDSLDRGTAVLLNHLKVEATAKTALDLGCGYGPIGLVLHRVFGLEVDMVDVNERALSLATTNIKQNDAIATVFYSDGFNDVNRSYDLIVSNPPIRVGKEKLYQLLSGAVHHLHPGGSFVFVINKKHGAKSALHYVETIYSSVEVLGKDKGFYVITCKK
ncbi:class I SAM-dependent methyltransferase [Candidatus Xianfuyuplasma coldseepsis]|uniref:Class I SAM-dependent methyltransferase n=1 Tax=Candidatus Xianfuyuplasma coldseepsis TaxID=2782163 RepID=A0A7L7KRM6_9MOLU|nr:methyltransferase [Xianfuyuplasma coldseepsis]QMS85357.1 class I SAM-dependent methyltransferase [Xianfuyuplasma coldseepsis]